MTKAILRRVADKKYRRPDFIPSSFLNTVMNVLFFSRGRGYGHAIPDMVLAAAIGKIQPDINVQFVSYASGAQIFRKRGHRVIDMQLPETNPFLVTVDRAREVIQRNSVDMIVAHEEFAALYAAHTLNVPSLFISAWLPPPGTINAESLRFCNSIIVLGHAGLFPVQENMRAKPIYTGPLIRPMVYGKADRVAVRRDLGYAENDYIAVVLPGGANSEAQTPISDLVLSAFFSLEIKPKRLIWVSAKDFGLMESKIKGLDGIDLHSFYDPIEKLMVAADVILTKGTRGTTFEAATLGVPTISLSSGHNPVDDTYVSRIANNIALNVKAVTPEVLGAYMGKVRRNGSNNASLMQTPLEINNELEIAQIMIGEMRKALDVKSSPVGGNE